MTIRRKVIVLYNDLLEGYTLGPQRKSPRQSEGFRDADFRSQRESSDTPKVNAFCRVAPVLRLSDRAIFAAGVF
jgi:hypothetical protein